MKINKDFKTILILWIVSILVSWLWLYQFKDVHFKNTKKLEKENEKQQEQLVEKYNALVDVYIPTITDKVSENSLPKTWTITLVIPWFLENKWFYTLSDNLYDKDISLYIKKIDSYSKYENEIKTNLQNYDIALIPMNRLSWLAVQDITLWENIKPYFIPIFEWFLKNDTNTFIPFSIDPAITMYQNIPEQKNWNNLFSYSLLRKASKKYAMPIIWWFDTMSLKLLENNDTPFENFSELLILHLKQIKIKWDNQELSYMLNTNNISSNSNYTYTNFKKISELLLKQNEYCKIYPANCIMRYGYADIKFWFISDLDIISKYFPWENNIYIWDFTNSDKSYPIKWRVFIVPKWNENTNLTNTFFSEYISESIDWNESFRNNTLSSITNIYDEQKTKKVFENIFSNEKNFYIFTWNINAQSQLVNDWKTIEMLKWNYNVSTYLSNFQY